MKFTTTATDATVCAAVSVILAVITGIKPEEIDILVTTSSVFAPTPSVASMLVNMFKMREDVQVCAVWQIVQ
jgi:3-ketoacyl-CoA synthase